MKLHTGKTVLPVNLVTQANGYRCIDYDGVETFVASRHDVVRQVRSLYGIGGDGWFIGVMWMRRERND
jgi:hypothetical protein